LSKSIETRHASVSYLNTGKGLSGGHPPARSIFISDCCPRDESPALLGLGRSCSFKFMTGPKRCARHSILRVRDPQTSGRGRPDECGSNPLRSTCLGGRRNFPESCHPQPGPAGLVASLRSKRPGSGDFSAGWRSNLRPRFEVLANKRRKTHSSRWPGKVRYSG